MPESNWFGSGAANDVLSIPWIGDSDLAAAHVHRSRVRRRLAEANQRQEQGALAQAVLAYWLRPRFLELAADHFLQPLAVASREGELRAVAQDDLVFPVEEGL